MKSERLFAFCLCTIVLFSTTACDTTRSANDLNSKSSSTGPSGTNLAPVSSDTKTGSDGGASLPNSQTATGKWVEKAPMSTPRFACGSAVVGGKIYMFGGLTTDNYHETTSVEAYNPQINQWQSRRSIPVPYNETYINMVVLDDKIYKTYDTDGKGDNGIEQYDPATDTWTKLKLMITNKRTFSLAVLDGEVYAIGGEDHKENPLSSVEAYDPVSNTWVKKASMLSPRQDFATEVVDGKIYVIGNLVNGVPDSFGPMEMYDPKTNQWTKEAAINVRRTGFQAETVDGKIYVIGGRTPGSDGGSIAGVLTSVEEYDPATNKWTMKAPTIDKKGSFQTAVLNGKIYVIGGWNDIKYGDQAANYLSSLQEYDPKTNKWTEKSPLKVGRKDFVTAVVDDCIYAIGGRVGPDRGGIGTALVEEYTAIK